MWALARKDNGLKGPLQEMEARRGPEGVLVARVVVNDKGTFIKFGWPDWPEALSNSARKNVHRYFGAHSDLLLIAEGSKEWLSILGCVNDALAAAQIGERLSKFFPGRVSYVAASRDPKGKVTAVSFIEGVGGIEWQLSWRGAAADYRFARFKDVDVQAMNSAVREISAWAQGRIRPILDQLQAKMSKLYGDRFRALYVFGSYARPDAGIELPIDSDLDIALILSSIDNRCEEIQRISDITFDLDLEHGISVSVTPMLESDFREGSTNFARDIAEYAIPV